MGTAFDIDALIFGEKHCPTCGRDLPANSEHFHVDRYQADGLTRECKACRSDRGHDYYLRHRRKAPARPSRVSPGGGP